MFKKLLFYTICGMAKIRSVHTYVIPWIHWFEPNCSCHIMKDKRFGLVFIQVLSKHKKWKHHLCMWQFLKLSFTRGKRKGLLFWEEVLFYSCIFRKVIYRNSRNLSFTTHSVEFKYHKSFNFSSFSSRLNESFFCFSSTPFFTILVLLTFLQRRTNQKWWVAWLFNEIVTARRNFMDCIAGLQLLKYKGLLKG